MPPKAKVTRDMILDAAFDLVRSEGHEELTVRRLAAKLGCSTQPLMYQFAGIAEIRRAVYDRAGDFHTAYITAFTGEYQDPLLEMGIRYIRFGAEEKALFRFLFQSGELGGKSLDELIADPGSAPILDVVTAGGEVAKEQAAKVFHMLFMAVHGWASLLANNAMRWQEDEAAEMLVGLFMGLTNEGGNPHEKTL